MREAWAQLSQLNRLYDWGMFAKLIQQTVPRLVLDHSSPSHAYTN